MYSISESIYLIYVIFFIYVVKSLVSVIALPLASDNQLTSLSYKHTSNTLYLQYFIFNVIYPHHAQSYTLDTSG